MREHPPFSYKDNPVLADLDDSAPIAVVDGDCALCAFGARMITRFDHTGSIRICPATSPTGAALMRHYGLDPAAPDSWLFLADGRAHSSLDAIIRVGETASSLGLLLTPLRLLPRAARDWIYRRIARNRYAVFGRADLCALPDPAVRARLME